MEFFPEIQNTCAVTGVFCDGVWAKNLDEARAGLGVCEAVAKDMEGANVIIAVESEAVTKRDMNGNNMPLVELGTIRRVLSDIRDGRLTPQEALQSEKAGKGRPSLIKKLEVMING